MGFERVLASDGAAAGPSSTTATSTHIPSSFHNPDNRPLAGRRATGTRLDLLAHCVSYGVNALFERPNPYSGSGVSQHGLDVRFSQVDRLARATGLPIIPMAFGC